MKFIDKNGVQYRVADKPIIDDEIVERARNTFPKFTLGDLAIRQMLEAALAPQEPEIVVTEEMIIAGQKAYLKANLAGENEAAEVYRAMRKLEPKPTGSLSRGFNNGFYHTRIGDGPVHEVWHRRKDDPK